MPASSANFLVVIVALGGGPGCLVFYPSAKEEDTAPVDTGEAPSACERQCEDDGLPELPINVVELNDDTDAPQPTSTDTGCLDTDTDWPCVHPNSLNDRFVTEDGHRVCADTGIAETCVRFRLGAHAFRTELDANADVTSDANCAEALNLPGPRRAVGQPPVGRLPPPYAGHRRQLEAGNPGET